MIAFVRGPVTTVMVDSAVIEVGGIGIQVMCTPATLAGLRIGEQSQLATSMVVREDSLTLFGFADHDERTIFELLQTASGVGPKLAQAMLAVHGPEALRRAVATDDLVALTRVPGIGRKGAQRIVLELKDRIGVSSGAAPVRPGTSPVDGAEWRGQVHAGLVGLGWPAREAEVACDRVTVLADAAVAAGDAPDVPELLRAALQTLSKA